MAALPTPLPQPDPPPWSWTVAELGSHLTASQQASLLARFRALGFAVTTWSK